MFDELTTPDPAGVATLTDPDAGQRPHCPCGGCPGWEKGAMPGWHLRRGVAPILSAHMATQLDRSRRIWDFLEHGSYGDLRQLVMPAWIDHPYRLRLPDGRWRYVAEPYSLGGGAFTDLAYLESAGFAVKVTAWQSRHFPGRTVAVSITAPAAG